MNLSEFHFYHALNQFYKGDYSKLKIAAANYKNWESACLNICPGQNPEKEWEKLEKCGSKLALKEDPVFPPLLREIPSPPFGLYFRGAIDFVPPAIAIVGTRKVSSQGKTLAKEISKKLSEAGFTIISGLAMGVDTAAHQGALEGGGKTLAVLGTPINYIYPAQNENLAENILQSGGGLISEFPSNNEYHPQNFLIRNRIISGPANAVLIIEAPERSGALATAKFALDQNREIFVAPGKITDANYRGSNQLIKAGAAILTDVQDILEYFNVKIDAVSKPVLDLNPEETIIVQACQNPNGISSEDLSELTQISASAINKNLALLTIKGIIKESNGKYFLN